MGEQYRGVAGVDKETAHLARERGDPEVQIDDLDGGSPSFASKVPHCYSARPGLGGILFSS